MHCSKSRKTFQRERIFVEDGCEIKPRPHPMSTRKAEALVRMAEHCLSGNLSGKSCSGSERFVINVHTNLDTLNTAGCGAESEVAPVPARCCGT